MNRTVEEMKEDLEKLVGKHVRLVLASLPKEEHFGKLCRNDNPSFPFYLLEGKRKFLPYKTIHLLVAEEVKREKSSVSGVPTGRRTYH